MVDTLRAIGDVPFAKITSRIAAIILKLSEQFVQVHGWISMDQKYLIACHETGHAVTSREF
jgi:hypothetical protein